MTESRQPPKQPPHDLQAEKAVLGSILLDTNVISDIMEILRNRDFYHEANRLIFRCMEELYEQSTPLDILTLSDALKKKGELDKLGGDLYLAQLADYVPTSAHAYQYARVVKEKSTLRTLISTGSQIVESAYGMEEVEDILENAERLILSIGESYMERSYAPIGKVVNDAFGSLEKIKIRHESPEGNLYVTGVPTGFRALDQLTTGFHPSDLVIVAARPSMGKSALALHLARNMAVDFQKRVGIFSLEMSSEQIALRLLSLESRVPFEKLRRAELVTEDWNRLTDAASRLMKTSIIIDDDSLLDPRGIRTKARRMKKEYGLDVVIVDYIQLMNSTRNRENRQQEITEISRSLKILAKELDVVVISASQLSRAIEQREDKRPRLSDLRESGAIEQDADTVMFIHREAYYQRNIKEEAAESDIRMINRPHEAEIIIGKQRNGPIGTIQLMFDPTVVGFFSIDSRFHSPSDQSQ